jgi:glycosyltransferase involved in cell wall biosynthesis
LVDRYGLTTSPTVVCNMPEQPSQLPASGEASGVRGALGLGPDIPLLVHAGVVAPVRGLATIVRTLPHLDGVHLALLTGSRTGHVAELVGLAESLGCGDRLHILDYVPAEDLSPYLATATAGIEPLLHTPHHDLTVTTKFWSYVNARLPIVVSDVEAMASLTHDLAVGEVFAAGDVDSAVRAIQSIIDDRERYADAYPADMRRFTWEDQADALLSLYAEVTGFNPKA